jgi:hypothetical protein
MNRILSALLDEDNREIYAGFLAILLEQFSLSMDSMDSMKIKKLGKETLDFAEVEVLAFQLSLQLQALEARMQTLLFWQISDLLVIQWPKASRKLYLLANLSQMVPLNKKTPTQLVLVYPTVYPLPKENCAPELLQITSLPFLTHRSASYYSLALLCLRLLKLDLAAINGTKLFYFLERCLHMDPKERACLYL